MKDYARGARHGSWKGGRTVINGYRVLQVHGHPRADPNGYVYEHVLVVERALGKLLRPTASVHHVNEDRTDNRNGNLVACQDNAYHMLLHQRQRALEACGHAGWRVCRVCRKYDDPANLSIPKKPKQSPAHRSCHAEYERRRRQGKR